MRRKAIRNPLLYPAELLPHIRFSSLLANTDSTGTVMTYLFSEEENKQRDKHVNVKSFNLPIVRLGESGARLGIQSPQMPQALPQKIIQPG